MHTVFSHIIQKRFSAVNEDVATDALAFVVESSEAGRRGLMKLLRGIVSDLPPLRFKTQQADCSIRPDMWGYSDGEPRVFVENKFWAGLTDNQPVAYLKRLAAFSQPTVLLVVAPAARVQTLWCELTRRLHDTGISVTPRETAAGVAFSATTPLGPILALTSWANILSVMEHEAVDEPDTRGNLKQLRALCDAADNEAFIPATNEQLSDQRTPAFILQLGTIVQSAVDLAVAKNVVSIKGLRPVAWWEWIGRYARLVGDHNVGVWIGIHFGIWKVHGISPLWLTFSDSEFGRAQEVRALIEPWAAKKQMFTVTFQDDFAIALRIPVGEEKAGVVRSVANDLEAIARVLDVLPPRSTGDANDETDQMLS